MTKFKCKYGHSKFSIAGTKYETDINGNFVTEDSKIIGFLKDNNSFIVTDLPPTSAKSGDSVKAIATDAKKVTPKAKKK